MWPRKRVEALGGIATRAQLFAHGCTRDEIDLAVRYGWILSARRGLYVSVGVDPLVLRALRVGGRLACVSAVAWYEGRKVTPDEPIHVAVPHGASRLGAGAIVHWSRLPVAGSRGVVSEEVARRQAASCRTGAASRQC